MPIPPPPPQVSRSRAASAVMRFLEKHRVAAVAAAEREACQKAAPDAQDSEVGPVLTAVSQQHATPTLKREIRGHAAAAFCFARARLFGCVDRPL